MHQLLTAVFEPGFFASPQVHVAVSIGAVVAVVSAVTGVFTVMRGQSFAGHALGDVSAAGGSGALLIGLTPLPGFVGAGIAGAGVMDMIGVQRLRGRDLATGIVRGAGLGLGALFLYWDTTHTTTTGATITILFGSMFTINTSVIPVVAAFGLAAVGIVAALYRPLLLSSASSDLAVVRGVRVRATGALCLAAIALAVSLAALTIGAILSTALLVGPAATALRLTARPGLVMIWSAAIGLAATWLGILLAFDSYYWPSARQGWPVSFFVVSLVLIFYLLTLMRPAARGATPGRG